jgi:mono/diheme cytochrome c family protein
MLACVAGLALVLLASACSVKRYHNVDLVRGKQLFVAKCGACHTLARADTKGIIGPNLDDAFADSLAEGFKRSAVQGVVHGQILNPNPGGAMPSGLLSTGAEVNDVAAYVASAVANPGQDTGLLATAVPSPTSGKPAVESGGQLEIDADPSGQLAYTAKTASATAGPLTIKMKNAASIPHNIALQQGTSGPVLGATALISGGASTTLHVNVKPGTYTYFCQVPGHRAAGMYGTLTVK